MNDINIIYIEMKKMLKLYKIYEFLRQNITTFFSFNRK